MQHVRVVLKSEVSWFHSKPGEVCNWMDRDTVSGLTLAS